MTSTEIQRVFAKNMRCRRKTIGLTQEELAEQSGLHRTYIGGIEQQRINVSIKNVERIAQALDVDPSFLFQQDDGRSLEEVYGRLRSLKSEDPAAQYALCTAEGNDFTFDIIDVKEEDVAMRILRTLIKEGLQGDELLNEFHLCQEFILDLFERNRQQAHGQSG